MDMLVGLLPADPGVGFRLSDDLPLMDFKAPLLASVTYVVTMNCLRLWMKARDPIRLETLSIAHNFVITLFSAVVCVMITRGFVAEYQEHGWFSLICTDDTAAIRGSTYYWCYIYYISKFYEYIGVILSYLHM